MCGSLLDLFLVSFIVWKLLSSGALVPMISSNEFFHGITPHCSLTLPTSKIKSHCLHGESCIMTDNCGLISILKEKIINSNETQLLNERRYMKQRTLLGTHNPSGYHPQASEFCLNS